MATKSKTTSKSKAEPKDITPERIAKIQAKIKKDRQRKPTVRFAEQGHELSSLLWRKIQANVTPEVREMLFVQLHLAHIWDEMAPNDSYRVPHAEVTHENLLKEIRKAEYLLTGFTHRLADYEYPEG